MTTPARQQIFAFVLATKDDHLWMNWWDGSQWAWVDHVGPPGWVGGQGLGAPGGIVAHGSWPPNMSLLHLGKDGRLWARAWDLAKWTWNDLGPWPSAPILTFSVGATLYKGAPYLFFKGHQHSDLWVCWWDGAVWAWAGLGAPPAPTPGLTNITPGAAHPVGTAVYEDMLYVFVTSSPTDRERGSYGAARCQTRMSRTTRKRALPDIMRS
jgi:hypothetical protein